MLQLVLLQTEAIAQNTVEAVENGLLIPKAQSISYYLFRDN